MAIPEPLTKKQLKEIVECYATVFPGWKCLAGNRLERSSGPIVQQIGFEALRSGAYRPAVGVWPLPLPTVYMLHQFLDIKHEQVLLREHPTKWKGMVTAMEEQFRPSIRQPMDVWEVKELCEKVARPLTNDLCMLAILNAYLGEKEKALACCDKMEKVGMPEIAPNLDRELQRLDFGLQLRKAIEAGTERQFFETCCY